MKLHIYDKDKIVKTYEVEDYRLKWGTIEDLTGAVNMDRIKKGTDDEILALVADLMFNSMDTVKELLMDIFPAITAEEIRNCAAEDIAKLLLDVLIYTVLKIDKTFGGAASKKLAALGITP